MVDGFFLLYQNPIDRQVKINESDACYLYRKKFLLQLKSDWINKLDSTYLISTNIEEKERNCKDWSKRKMKRKRLFRMLNGPSRCSVDVYTSILIGQAVAWKDFSFTDGVKGIKSPVSLIEFFLDIYTHHSRLKNDTNNNNETDGSKWLIVVVSLDTHCSITVSLSLSVSFSLLLSDVRTISQHHYAYE